MEPHVFDELMEEVKPALTKQDTNIRSFLTAHEKLCLTLRFLASGASYKDLMYTFRVSDSTISEVVPNVCKVFYEHLKDECARVPQSKEEWMQISKQFEEKWQFPHCLVAIDGKHVNIRAPPDTGSEYFNYKKQFSVVLLWIADADALSIAFDIGAPGSQSDGGIFKHGCLSNLCQSASIPPPSEQGDQVDPIPYFFIGEEAFALTEQLIKPYPHCTAIGDEKVYNYRLSRPRRNVENAFGIMCARFRILLRTMELNVANAIQVIRACVVLHNSLTLTEDKNYSPPGSEDSENETGSGHQVHGEFSEWGCM